MVKKIELVKSELEVTSVVQQALSSDASMLAIVCKAVSENWGEKGMAVLQAALEKELAPGIAQAAKAAGIRTGDGTIEDWARLEQYAGRFMGIDAEWEITPERGLQRMVKCPYAKRYAKVFGRTCPDVLIGCERAIAHVVNPHLQVRGQKYMTTGDDVCELVVEWEEGYVPGK